MNTGIVSPRLILRLSLCVTMVVLAGAFYISAQGLQLPIRLAPQSGTVAERAAATRELPAGIESASMSTSTSEPGNSEDLAKAIQEEFYLPGALVFAPEENVDMQPEAPQSKEAALILSQIYPPVGQCSIQKHNGANGRLLALNGGDCL